LLIARCVLYRDGGAGDGARRWGGGGGVEAGNWGVGEAGGRRVGVCAVGWLAATLRGGVDVRRMSGGGRRWGGWSSVAQSGWVVVVATVEGVGVGGCGGGARGKEFAERACGGTRQRPIRRLRGAREQGSG